LSLKKIPFAVNGVGIPLWQKEQFAPVYSLCALPVPASASSINNIPIIQIDILFLDMITNLQYSH